VNPGPVIPERPRWGTEVVLAQVLGHPCLTFDQRLRDIRDLAIDARRFPERDYLMQERHVTFADREAAVSSVAAALRDHGVRPGDRVMLLGANSIEWVPGSGSWPASATSCR
jgi:long-chain acyl-CoA synthetase